VSGFNAILSFPSINPGLNHGETKLSMKKAGRKIVYEGKPSERIFISIRHLLSKCGIPVLRWAEPTDE
jgi:hypothetical protein